MRSYGRQVECKQLKIPRREFPFKFIENVQKVNFNSKIIDDDDNNN